MQLQINKQDGRETVCVSQDGRHVKQHEVQKEELPTAVRE